MNTLTMKISLKSWLLGAHPAPDENKIHPWGLLLGITNLLLILFGRLAVASGIGIADDYSCSVSGILPGWALLIPLTAPFIALVLLALRQFCHKRWSYLACTGLILLLTAASLAVVIWNFWAVGYIYEHFQPLH